MSNADGYLKIKTKIDNSGVDKEIQNLENKIKRLQESNLDNFNQEKELQSKVDKYEELIRKVEDYKNKISELQTIKDGNLVITNPSELAELQISLNEANTEIAKQESGMNKVYTKLKQIKQKQVENNQKISEYQEKIDQIETNKIKSGIDSVGKSLQTQIGKISKMAMAVAGVRTAWAGVRKIMSLVQQYNPQISADLEYMGYAIAQIFLPIAQKLVSILYTILNYVNAIMTAWFGINLFSNSGVKNFQKMSKNAKEINKFLAGFDEMNVIQDNSSSSKNSAIPSMDLSEGMQGEVPIWLQWIIDNKELILTILEGIGAAILAIKLGLSGIQGLGIGMMIVGIISTIQNLIKYLQDPSWDNFGKIITSIGVAILGLGLIIGNVPLIIAATIVIIVGLIVSNWESIKNIFQKGIDWLTNLQGNFTNWFIQNLEQIGDKFGIVGQLIIGIIVQTFNYVVEVIKGSINIVISVFDGLYTGIKQIFDGIIKIFKGDFKNGFISIGKGILNILIGIINGFISGLNTILYPIRGLISSAGKILGKSWTISSVSIPKIPLLATGGIVDLPRRGVNIGGAIAGEAGAEGVIPLTDQRAMETLGETIGRYITINANITNTMNGRVISRQLQQIKNEENFAYNM
jgi:hypothetical protein